MSFLKALLHGWTLETDPATGNYIFGSVPYYTVQSYDLMKFYLYKKPKTFVKKAGGIIYRSAVRFADRFPKIALACTAAVATVGYFVGVGVAWSVAAAILRFIKVF
uniref:Uncharacterized protein n=1 Tax=Baoding Fusar tick virus 1 TaxID=2972102 RepID=A0A9E7V1T9_9VIRU|nr:MAG: hypothetical protein [Baoding Fusar tick virus 1]